MVQATVHAYPNDRHAELESELERALVRTADAFLRAADLLADRWDDLEPDTRSTLIASIDATAAHVRRVLEHDRRYDHPATLDELLAARLACL